MKGGVVRGLTGLVLAAAGATGGSRAGPRGAGAWGPRTPRAAPSVGALRTAAPRRRPVAAHAAVARPPLIFPAQQIPLRFDHARHLKLGAHCDTCHVWAPTSTVASDNLIPTEAACRSCHEIDRARPDKAVPAARPRRAATPATSPAAAPAEMPSRGLARAGRACASRTPNLKFNHACTSGGAWAAQALPFGRRHGGARDARRNLPKMALCLGCHDGSRRRAAAAACHITEPDGRLRTNIASAATGGTGLVAGLGPLVPSGVAARLDEHGPAVRARPRGGGARGALLPVVPQAQRVRRLPRRHGAPVRHPPVPTTSRVHGTDARRNTPDCSSATGRRASAWGATSARGSRPTRPAAQLGRFRPATLRHGHPAQDLPPAGGSADNGRPERPRPAGAPEHPHLRGVPPGGELPRLPLDGPDARMSVSPHGPSLRGHVAAVGRCRP